ncbi:hypothetical protein NPIL_695321, partial [Nephila pilipes]
STEKTLADFGLYIDCSSSS